MEEEDDDEDRRFFFGVDRIPTSKQPVDSSMVRMLGFEKSPMASSILRSNFVKMFILGVLIVFSLTTFSSVCNSTASLNDFEEFTVFPEIVESATTESQSDVQFKEDDVVQFSELQSEVLSDLVFISNASAYASTGDVLILDVVRSEGFSDSFFKVIIRKIRSKLPRYRYSQVSLVFCSNAMLTRDALVNNSKLLLKQIVFEEFIEFLKIKEFEADWFKEVASVQFSGNFNIGTENNVSRVELRELSREFFNLNREVAFLRLQLLGFVIGPNVTVFARIDCMMPQFNSTDMNMIVVFGIEDILKSFEMAHNDDEQKEKEGKKRVKIKGVSPEWHLVHKKNAKEILRLLRSIQFFNGATYYYLNLKNVDKIKGCYGKLNKHELARLQGKRVRESCVESVEKFLGYHTLYPHLIQRKRSRNRVCEHWISAASKRCNIITIEYLLNLIDHEIAKGFDKGFTVQTMLRLSKTNPDEMVAICNVLATLIQNSTTIQKRFGTINGVDVMLQAMEMYKSLDPKTP